MSDSIYAFHISTLETALDEWKAEQLAAYPHKSELIETVALAMMDFMRSEQVEKHKMLVEHSSRKKY